MFNEVGFSFIVVYITGSVQWRLFNKVHPIGELAFTAIVIIREFTLNYSSIKNPYSSAIIYGNGIRSPLVRR